MKGEVKHLGYTIVEVMVVLAVSGMMFVIAAGFVNGKQARTAFTYGSNELASRLQDTIEQVTDGQYSDISLQCTYSSGTGTNPNAVPTGTEQQGTNSNCVFLGKVLHFATDGNRAKYDVFPMAGGRVGVNDTPITELVNAKPKVINSLITVEDTPQQLDIVNIKVTSSTGVTGNSYMIGFFQSQGSFDSSTNSLDNGIQVVRPYYVDSAGDNLSKDAAVTLINGGGIVEARSIDICLTDGTRYASILLGVDGGQLATTVKAHGTVATCA